MTTTIAKIWVENGKPCFQATQSSESKNIRVSKQLEIKCLQPTLDSPFMTPISIQIWELNNRYIKNNIFYFNEKGDLTKCEYQSFDPQNKKWSAKTTFRDISPLEEEKPFLRSMLRLYQAPYKIREHPAIKNLIR